MIGVGKTSLACLLAEQFEARTVLEKVRDNPFLPKFYKDRKTNAFQTQLWFLLSRYRQLSDELLQQDLFHCATVSDYMFAKDRIFAAINLDEDELALYDNVAGVLESHVPKPDLVIYLQASTDVLLRRIRARGRVFEGNMDPEYLEVINKAYNQFFFHYSDSPVLVINTSEIDFVHSALDLDEIIKQIGEVKPGVTFFQPMKTEDRIKIEKQQASSDGSSLQFDPAD